MHASIFIDCGECLSDEIVKERKKEWFLTQLLFSLDFDNILWYTTGMGHFILYLLPCKLLLLQNRSGGGDVLTFLISLDTISVLNGF